MTILAAWIRARLFLPCLFGDRSVSLEPQIQMKLPRTIRGNIVYIDTPGMNLRRIFRSISESWYYAISKFMWPDIGMGHRQISYKRIVMNSSRFLGCVVQKWILPQTKLKRTYSLIFPSIYILRFCERQTLFSEIHTHAVDVIVLRWR